MKPVLPLPLSIWTVSLAAAFSVPRSDPNVDIVMTAAGDTVVMIAPNDGTSDTPARLTSDLACVLASTSKKIACDQLSISRIAIMGTATCAFLGFDGWIDAQTPDEDGTVSYLDINPPQAIRGVTCGN